MKNKNLLIPSKLIKGECSANTCMVGINYLYSFSNKLENKRT